MSELIRGKVARILNSRELVINVGASKGVELGMFFDVLNAKGKDIRDPDTNEVLGSVERSKVRVKVIKVDEKLAVASTFKSTRVNFGGAFDLTGGLGVFARSLLPPNWVTKYESLKTEDKSWEDLDEKESYVKIGDPVVQVLIEKENPEDLQVKK